MKIPPRKYAEALAECLKGSEDPKKVIRSLLILLRRRKQFRLLPKILKAFNEEWNKRNGIINLEVTYPTKFADSVKELKKNLGEKLGKEIQMQTVSSDSLIGGFRVHFEDTLIDASIEGRLKSLATRLN